MDYYEPPIPAANEELLTYNVANTGTNTSQNDNLCNDIFPENAVNRPGFESDGIAAGDKSELWGHLQSSKEAYFVKRAAWLDLLDGGDTDQWMTTVQSANSTNAAVVLTDLQNLAPYLSQPVLLAAVQNSAFDASDLYDLLGMHPEVLQDPFFFAALEQSGLWTPTELADLRDIAESTTSVRGTEMAKVNAAEQAWQYWINLQISTLYKDTLAPNLDSVRFWLKQNPSLYGDYAIAQSYLAQDSNSLATAWLDSIELRHVIDSSLQAEWHLQKSFLQWKVQIVDSTDWLHSLDNGDLTFLEQLAQDSDSRTGAQAEALLNFAYGYDYIRAPELPEPAIAPRLQQEEETPVVESLQAYPNPSRGWLVVHYQLPKESSQANLRFYSPNGQMVHEQALEQVQGQALVQLPDLPAGVYFYTIFYKEGQSAVRRLVLAP